MPSCPKCQSTFYAPVRRNEYGEIVTSWWEKKSESLYCPNCHVHLRYDPVYQRWLRGCAMAIGLILFLKVFIFKNGEWHDALFLLEVPILVGGIYLAAWRKYIVFRPSVNNVMSKKSELSP